MKKLLFLVIPVLLIVMVYALFENEPSAVTYYSDIEAKSIYMMDLETDEILYEENSNASVPIASMTKMMTQYIVLNAIEDGTIQWEDRYSPSSEVLAISLRLEFANLRMKIKGEYTVRELFTAASVFSANDATIALAEVIGGTEEDFVRLMNEQATQFNLENTRFYNSTGLDGPYIGKTSKETNSSTAHDVAVIANHLIEDHPAILEFASIPKMNTEFGVKRNTNLMLDGMPYEVDGVDGLKTGFTDEAGSCFASTGIFNGRRILTVVIGASANNADTINPRFRLTKYLLSQYAS